MTERSPRATLDRMRMLGRYLGSGFCTCVACVGPEYAWERRRIGRRKRQTWRRETVS